MSKGRTAQTSEKKLRLRRAIGLLLFICACLVVILILLPDGGEEARPPVSPAGPEDSRRQERPARAERPPQPVQPAAAARPERPLRPARVAIVIDDVGYTLDALDAFLSFPGPITFSVLPNLPHSREAARRIRQAGKELILHLPMEAVNGNDPGPGAILTSQTDETIRDSLERSFAQVPGAVGMNNHMGSKATTDERVMSTVMKYLQQKNRFFLDSRTTAQSVAGTLADRFSVPFMERDVFLDNDPDQVSIRRALQRGVELARAEGSVVMIGHIYNPQIVAAMQELLAELDAAGVELASLSELLREQGARP